MTSQGFDTHAVLERLHNLEKQNRWLTRALVLVFVLVGSFAAMGMARKARAVEATEFILRDSDGSTRAALRMGNTGPRLVFYDADGKAARVLLGVLGSGPALGLYDKNGKTRVALGVTMKGANLTFNDADEKLRAELGMLEEGPNLMLLNADGTPVYKTR
jgi:hypothetical protein